MRGWLKEHRLVLRDLGALGTLALIVRLLTALPMQHPGYMDAFYYLEGGRALNQGQGFQEFLIWNYLDPAQDIPHPSHSYWMPLSSILVYLGFSLFGPTFRAAQLPFVLLSALLPLIAYGVAYEVSCRRRHAWCAGLLALFSGFYMIRWPAPDNFAPFAVTGSICLWALGRGFKTGRWGWFAVAGAAAGLAHLSRSDGMLLLVVPILVAGIGLRVKSCGLKVKSCKLGIVPFAICYLLFALGYLLVMLPWFVRNVQVIGMPLPSAGTRTLWLTDYDDLFSYDKPLNLSTYLAWGWGNILRSKAQGLWLNLQTLLFVDWMIALAPFGLIGVWRLRGRAEFVPAWGYGLCLYLAMSLGFTYPGIRGAMFHSTAALLPFLYAAAMEGLDAAVEWAAARRRGWQVRQAQGAFGAGLILIAMLVSGFAYWRALPQYRSPHIYETIAEWMVQEIPLTARVMVGDPAAFRYYSGRECLVVPNGDVDMLLRVAGRYGARYVILDENAPLPLRPIYDQLAEPFELLRRFEGANGKEIYVYQIG
ncbi:MAG: glycosyltransferase family 39 protein [Anaerolineae bacterium]|nr:glycosyltransferase family 39 protein [Anaerolineae bacterium]